MVVGALGLTAGYCGTLMTPMAANFNILPAALLETKNKYIVILSQLPVALVMLAVHIVLMYTLAFRYCSFLYTMHKLYLIFNEVYRVNLKIFWDILGNNFQQFFRKDDIL